MILIFFYIMREGGAVIVGLRRRYYGAYTKTPHGRRPLVASVISCLPPPRKGSRAWGRVEDPATTEAGSAGPATAPLDPEIRLRRGSYFHRHKLPFCRPPPRRTSPEFGGKRIRITGSGSWTKPTADLNDSIFPAMRSVGR